MNTLRLSRRLIDCPPPLTLRPDLNLRHLCLNSCRLVGCLEDAMKTLRLSRRLIDCPPPSPSVPTSICVTCFCRGNPCRDVRFKSCGPTSWIQYSSKG